MNHDPLSRLDRFFTSTPPASTSRTSLCFSSLGGAELHTEHGSTLVLTREYAWASLPASASFVSVREKGWRLAALDPRLPAHTALSGLACLDIETTGLSLGTGTVAFLIGVISANDTGLVLKQFLIRDFPEEAAQQVLLSECMQHYAVVCTYNGARFDLPILRSRSILQRVLAPWLDLPHLDLLYPVRAVWQKVWPDCRLATAEMRLLGVVRHQDCEGWEVPLRYRQFLALPAEDTLLDVLEHNAQDLVSLFCLSATLERLHSDEGAGFGLSQAELLGLARSVCARGQRDLGLRLYAEAHRMGRLAPDFGRQMRHYVRLLKKHSRWSEARNVWLELAGSEASLDRIWAHLEEAKFLEHREKSPRGALAATLLAKAELHAVADPLVRARMAEELRPREDRLQRMQKAL